MMHFICLTIRAAASCSSERRTLVNKPLKALLNNLGLGLLLPIRLCWAWKDLDINGNGAGRRKKGGGLKKFCPSLNGSAS